MGHDVCRLYANTVPFYFVILQCQEWNPGPCICQALTLPLSYIPAPIPFYIRNLSIHGFWYHGRFQNQSPTDTDEPLDVYPHGALQNHKSHIPAYDLPMLLLGIHSRETEIEAHTKSVHGYLQQFESQQAKPRNSPTSMWKTSVANPYSEILLGNKKKLYKLPCE